MPQDQNEKRYKNCEILVCGSKETSPEEEKRAFEEMRKIFKKCSVSSPCETVKIGERSRNAYATVLKGYNNSKLVIKRPRKTDGTVDSVRYEYVVGCDLRRTVCKIAGASENFMKVYGYVHQGTSEYLIIERILPGYTLRELVCTRTTNPSIRDETLWSLVLQTLCALQVAQNQVNFTHYDLHFGNVLVRESKPGASKWLNYSYLDKRDRRHSVYVPVFDKVAVIIDYGRSRTNDSAKFLYDNEEHFRPYRFLMKRKFNYCDIRTFDKAYDTRRFCSILMKYVKDFRIDVQKLNEPHDAVKKILKMRGTGVSSA